MKRGWEIKKIKDICDKASSNIAQNKITELDGDYPVYGASGYVQNVDFYHRDTPYIGIVKDGSGVGRVNTYPAYTSLLGTLQYILPKAGHLLGYIAYALKSLHLASFASGAAIPHIYFKDYGECTIPVPPLPEQERIVAELDCLSSIIEEQKEQLKELDNLAQSIFYTMFGDPITNEKGWEVKTFGKEFEISSGGTPSTSNKQYWDNGDISWIGSNMCQNAVIYENDGKYITTLGLEKSSAKLYDEGYVLVALVGATIGKTALLKIRTSTNQNIAGINVPKNKEYNSVFVFYLLQRLYCLFEDIGGDKFKMANLGFVRSLPLMSPPILLQQEFASKIEAIEKQKELIKQLIAETETLFNSRMDYYFN
ncbi:MAG: hypothetical protein E7119_07920 [Bacteroidales bacterium]|nr:hypothetical protein [Bacteroidales bacterium]